MCIRDSYGIILILDEVMAGFARTGEWFALDAFDVRPDLICLLYTSDAADERSSVDLGGRRIIKKKKILHTTAADRYRITHTKKQKSAERDAQKLNCKRTYAST